MSRRSSWQGFGPLSPEELLETDRFSAALFGDRAGGHGYGEAHESDETLSRPDWLPIARQLPVTYKRPQSPMEPTILGVVVHTTNHGTGDETLERFQQDWQNIQRQSAHFMVDREGNIGQFRKTTEVAWHVNAPSVRYFGIEHIAKHNQALTEAQLEASARLIGDLAVLYQFPAQRLDPTTKRGIAIHIDFAYTGCGQSVFWSGAQRERTAVYDRLVRRAHDFATLGY